MKCRSITLVLVPIIPAFDGIHVEAPGLREVCAGIIVLIMLIVFLSDKKKG